MEFTKGEIYKNKTWNYLSPGLRFLSEEFIHAFNSITKLAVGIYDNRFRESHLEANYFYVLVLESDPHLPSFLSYVKRVGYFVEDYNKNFGGTFNCKIIVLDFKQEDFQRAMHYFTLGKYSQMYDKEDVDFLFTGLNRKQFKNVLLKSELAVEKHMKQVNYIFNTNLTMQEVRDFDEYELPPTHKEEVFNSSFDLYITSQEGRYKSLHSLLI